jgi:toxin-antitoxin system PIN domain toxin
MPPGIRLLDVNVLVPLLWPPHTRHERAQDWFTPARLEGWATCPLTELGCIRLLATPSVSQTALDVRSAARLLADSLTDAYHEFWPDDVALTGGQFAASLPHIQGPRQLTDRYLLALAAAHGGTLATFDRAVAAGLPADSPLLAHLEVVED